MPWGAGQEAIILISMGNAETIRIGSRTIRVPPTEGIALFQAAFWLRRRGYSVGRGSSFELPTNWILAVNPPAAERVASMDAACGELIRKQVGMIARGEPEPRIPRPVGGLVAASVLYAPVYVLFALGRRPGGKWFVVNDRCDSCGRCASQCPQGTIKWRRDKPYWGWDCQQCYRCINTCPQAAIEVSILTAVGTCAPAVISGRLFRLIPLPPGADRMPYSAICGVLLFVALTVCMAWLVHYLYGNTGMRRILPAWYFTARRRRYRHMDFDPAGFRRL
jgi:NAD-dependent dihydropyrimidine dehydrogenase PreA subunit